MTSAIFFLFGRRTNFPSGRWVGVTAGASAPEYLVQEVVDYLAQRGIDTHNIEQGEKEDVVFSLPRELRIDAVNL